MRTSSAPLMIGLATLLLAGCAVQGVPTRARLTIEAVDVAGAPAAAATPAPTPGPAGGSAADLPVPAGTPIQPDFFKTVEPPYKKGAVWRRRVTGGGNTLIDITEVLDVAGDLAHLRQQETREDGVVAVPAREYDISITGNPLTAALPSAIGPNAVPLRAALQGHEDVTVPAGTYPGCTKLGFSGLDVDVVYTGTAWLAPGVGLVKLVASSGGESPVSTTQELLSLVAP